MEKTKSKKGIWIALIAVMGVLTLIAMAIDAALIYMLSMV